MAQDNLALEHVHRLVRLGRAQNLEHVHLEMAEEFLARRNAGLSDQPEGGVPTTSLCDTCLHTVVCVVYNMCPAELEIKVGACRAHLAEPAELSSEDAG